MDGIIGTREVESVLGVDARACLLVVTELVEDVTIGAVHHGRGTAVLEVDDDTPLVDVCVIEVETGIRTVVLVGDVERMEVVDLAFILRERLVVDETQGARPALIRDGLSGGEHRDDEILLSCIEAVNPSVRRGISEPLQGLHDADEAPYLVELVGALALELVFLRRLDAGILLLERPRDAVQVIVAPVENGTCRIARAGLVHL